MTILEEANEIIYGARESDYGHPYDMAKGVADAWATHFGWSVKPADIAVAMILMKLVRERNKPKRDNRTDIAGYAGVLDRIIEREEQITQGGEGAYTSPTCHPSLHEQRLTIIGERFEKRKCGCILDRQGGQQ